MRRTMLGGLAVLGVAAIAATVQSAAQRQPAPQGSLKAEIRTTSYGIPHILADDYAGAGYGLGYAFAKADICEVANRWVTVAAQRSRYFGPDGDRDPRDAAATNLQSDFFWKKVLDGDVVGREMNLPAPLGPTPELRELVRGYAAGYNQYLAETGVDNIPDARCRGQEWVRPITEQDVYARALHWNIFREFTGNGNGTLINPFSNAAPPTANSSAFSHPPASPLLADADRPGSSTSFAPEVIDGPASNMVALGKDATDNGRGMMFANPHWRWHGSERWFEAQLTIPGKLDVYGSGILGLPVVLFGHTKNVGWSHTISTPRRYTVYELKLAPGDATSYVYDGQVRKMTSRNVTVDVKETNGSISRRSHTFWDTHYGPVLEDATYGWTSNTAYAARVMTMSFRWLNQQLAMNQSQSVEDLDAAGRTYMAIGFLNTIAADSAGRALYADRSAVPHVTNAQIDTCVTSALGKQLLERRQIVLDGSRSACEWGTDPDTPAPGMFGPSTLPKLAVTDYVAQSNDSYWVNSARHPLEGFPFIVGDERTQRTLRTRIGLLKLERRLNGTDGHPGKQFTLDQFEAITMDNRVLSGEMWRDSLVAACRKMPARKGLPEACDVLAKWDLTQNTDSRGAVLWRRFYENLFPQGGARPEEGIFTVPFDHKDPANTPRGLETNNPRVAAALTAAVSDLLDSGIALDARYGDYHYDVRNGERIPIPGGDPGPGQYNFIQVWNDWSPGKGWTVMKSGSSYIMWVQFTEKGPVGRSIMTYSQSSNPDSPNHADQTKLFSQKRSKPILFDEAAIMADPNLTIARISSSSKQTARK